MPGQCRASRRTRFPKCCQGAEMAEIGYAHRQAPMGRGGMVASCHPLASLAGVDVLKSGGTVADAAVAVNAVLAVTQPNYCGVGGDFFCLYYDAASKRVHFLNGAGRSGARARLEELGMRGLSRVPLTGPGSVSVPGATRAWKMLLERFGSRPLATLLEPAINYAKDGFPISDIVCQAIRARAETNDDREWHRVFVPGGRLPEPCECFRQVDLGRTLADLGADPDVFYTGWVSRAITLRLGTDGFVTASDLQEHSGEWGEPISTDYRGWTVYEPPPPTQGVAALLALNLLEGFDLTAHPPQSVEHLHLLIEMTKLAYADRDRWIADPQAAVLPVTGLLDKAYAARRRAAFDPRKAQSYAFGDPEGDTTGFVVVDGRGNIASVIESLFNVFGSGIVAPGTGVVLQNRGRHFSLDPEHPNVFAPRKRPFHTLIAAIAMRQERPLFGFATMGGNGQAMFHTQVLTNLIDYGMDMQEAIERPRFLIGAFLPDDAADAIYVESRVGAPV